jgi:hypothetical protein
MHGVFGYLLQYANQPYHKHIIVELVALDAKIKAINTTCTGQTKSFKSALALDMVLIAASTPTHLIPDSDCNVPNIVQLNQMHNVRFIVIIERRVIWNFIQQVLSVQSMLKTY